MRVRLVLVGLGNLRRVLNYAERNRVAPVTIKIIRLDTGRTRQRPDNFQITLPRQIQVALSRPPVERRLIMRPGFVPIIVVPPRPKEITERLLHFRPDAVVLVFAREVTDLLVQIIARVVQFGGVGIIRASGGTPLRIGETKRHPARFVVRN